MPETVMAADTTQCSCVQTGARACAVSLWHTAGGPGFEAALSACRRAAAACDAHAPQRLEVGASACSAPAPAPGPWPEGPTPSPSRALPQQPRAQVSVSGPCPRPTAAGQPGRGFRGDGSTEERAEGERPAHFPHARYPRAGGSWRPWILGCRRIGRGGGCSRHLEAGGSAAGSAPTLVRSWAPFCPVGRSGERMQLSINNFSS
eukprot:COSAG01_NODE_1885_length_8988_cov_2.861514_7_plen_204_part_00